MFVQQYKSNIVKLHKPLLFLFRLVHNSKQEIYPLKQISWLYVSGERHRQIKSISIPYLPIEKIQSKLKEYDNNIKSRKLRFDLNEINKQIDTLKPIQDKFQALSDKYNSICKDIESNKEEKNQEFILEKETIHKELNHVRKEKIDLEDLLFPQLLKLPNWIPEDTPTEDIVVEEYGKSSFEFNARSHIELGKINNCVKFTQASPTCYYLFGQLALLELKISNWFSQIFRENSYVPLSCPDFVQTYIAEGVGVDVNQTQSTILLHDDKDDDGNKLHLVGASSFESLCSNLVRSQIITKTLPVKHVLFGRTYNPKLCEHSDLQSLFNVVQANCVRFSVVSTEDDHLDYFNESFELLKSCYSRIGVPFRIKRICASSMDFTTSIKFQFEVYSPHLRMYIPCGDIFLYGDFISRRLNIRYGKPYKLKGFCHLTSGIAVNVPVLLGCIMENFQTENGTFSIPDIFQDQ